MLKLYPRIKILNEKNKQIKESTSFNSTLLSSISRDKPSEKWTRHQSSVKKDGGNCRQGWWENLMSSTCWRKIALRLTHFISRLNFCNHDMYSVGIWWRSTFFIENEDLEVSRLGLISHVRDWLSCEQLTHFKTYLRPMIACRGSVGRLRPLKREIYIFIYE